MNKKDIAREITKRVSPKYTIENIEMIIDTMIEIFKESVKTNEKIDIRGFIQIEQKQHKATEGLIGNHKWSKPDRHIARASLSKTFKKECVYDEK